MRKKTPIAQSLGEWFKKYLTTSTIADAPPKITSKKGGEAQVGPAVGVASLPLRFRLYLL